LSEFREVGNEAPLCNAAKNNQQTRCRTVAFVRLQEVLATISSTRGGITKFPHPFPARMPEEVATAAVMGLTKPGDVVLDPMSGSSTVPYVSRRLGRIAIARDVDPLSILLGRTRCAHPDPDIVRKFCGDVLKEARAAIYRVRAPTRYVANLSDEDRAFLAYWFPTKAVLQLFALSDAICKRSADPAGVVGAIILSSLIISHENGASYARDLSRSRPHKVDSKKVRLPFDIWPEKVNAFSKFFDRTSTPMPLAPVSIKLGDARNLHDLEDESVDAIITSPPYLDAVDYIRTSKFSLIFLGCNLESLRAIRSTSIGTQVGLASGLGDSALDEMAEKCVSDAGRKAKVRRYLWDLKTVLDESFRVLRRGGLGLYILGPSILSRRDYDSIEVFSQIAEQAGLRAVGSTRRDLNATNRSMPPPNRQQRGQTINQRMTCEHYVIVRKPSS